MNSRKYRDVYYRMRYINDLRDLVHSSGEMFADDPAFLVKDKPGDEYRPVSFAQFEKDVDSLGTALTALGLKDKKIALIGENSYRWVVSYLSVTNGTGVVIPLDKELPEEELSNLLKRAEADAIIFSEKMEKKTLSACSDVKSIIHKIKIGPPLGEEKDYNYDDEIIDWRNLLSQGRKLLNEGNKDFVNAVIDRNAMCSLLFTSGTTGLAKGVMLSHRNIAANVYNMSKFVKIRRPGCGLSVLPMHHTYELTCHIFTGLYQGMCVAICEGLKYIQKNLKESQATVMLGVPVVFETMHRKVWKQAEASGAAGAMRRLMSVSRRTRLYNRQDAIRILFSKIHTSLGNNISLFIAGGAAIDPQVIRDYEAMGIPMIQGYGMTENSPIIAVNRDYYSKADSVGKPLPGTEVKIINKDGEGVGEVICKGPSVMLGYYNNPEATAEAIQDGWLFTGDYGRFDDEGFLYLCGRKKNVIVTKNGKNIFPEEIELLLGEQPVIEEVVVYGIVDKKNGDIIVKAEIFPSEEEIQKISENITEDGIRDIIKEAIEEVNDKMPSYKRVKRFKLRDKEFEKTTTRKIRRTGGAIREDEDE